MTIPLNIRFEWARTSAITKFATVVGSSCILANTSAQAFEISQSDANRVIAQVCSDLEPVASENGDWVSVPASRLAYFMASNASISTSEDSATAIVRTGVKRVENLNAGETPSNSDLRVFQTVGAVQIEASKPGNNKFRIQDSAGNVFARPAFGQDGHWSLNNGNSVQCFVKSATAKIGGKPIFGEILRLRGTVDELTSKGKAFQTAGSANFTYKRERTFLDDGTRKTTNSYALKGALGVALYDTPDSRLIPYASYQLDQVRVSPPPQLTPPATQGDGDTEILKLGLTAYQFYDINPDPFSTSPNVALKLDAAYIFDITKKSERLRANLALLPSFALPPNTLCAMGALVQTFVPGIKGSCELTLLGSINHLTSKGALQVSAEDEFIHAGFRIKGDWALGNDPKAGFITGAEYERQWVLHGKVRDIDRFQAYLKYRFWLDSGRKTAFDIGFDLTDGINPDSFEDENKLGVSFGVLF